MAARSGTKRASAPRRSAAKEKEEPTAIEAAPIEIEIESLDIDTETINWLLYGPEGHGKTILAGFAPNAVFLSTEPGSQISAKRAGSTAELIRAPDWEHVEGGIRWADQNMGPEDFLITDSWSKAQILYIRWLLRMRHGENAARDLDIPAIADHQKWQNAFMRKTDHLIAAPYNVIFIATDMIKEDEEGEDIVMPFFQGKNYAIAKYIAAQMNIVSYYAVSNTASTDDETIRRALFQPHPPYTAKERFGGVLGKYQDVGEKEYDKIAEWIDMIQNSG